MLNLKELLPYLFILVIAFTILHGIFTEGYLVRSDNSTHLQRAMFLKENILKNYQITGWNYLDNLGSPFLIYTYILSYILIVLLSFILPIHIAYKILVFLIFFTLPSLIYFITSKKFNKKAAILVSSFFFFHYTTIQQFLEGIWNQYLGMIFLLIFYYNLDKSYKKLNLKHISLLSILLALTLLSHLYLGIAALYLFGIYFLFSRNLKSLLIPIFSFLLTSFYFAPIIKSSSWTVNKIAWGISNSLFETVYKTLGILFSFQHLQNFTIKNLVAHIPILTLDFAAVIGIILYLKNRNNDFLKISLFFLIISIILGTGFWFNFPSLASLPLLGTILSSRFLIIAKIPLFFFATYTFSKLKMSLTIPLIILLIFSATLYQPSEGLLKTSENSPELEDYFNTINYLKKLEAKNIVFQSPYRTIDTGLITPINMAPLELNIPILGSWSDPVFPVSESITNSNKRLFNISIDEITEQQIIEKMELYNKEYLVTVTSFNFKILTKLKSFNNYTIYKLISKEKDYKFISYNKIEIKESKQLTLPVAYHPFLEVHQNSKNLEVINDNNLIKITPKKGIININFNQNNFIFILVSLITLLILIKTCLQRY
jgi:hypothetical protein